MNAAAHSTVQAASTSSASAVSSTHQSPAHIAQPQPQSIDQTADAFLRDFTLVAEAAKRAQMAVMMRDFESIGI